MKWLRRRDSSFPYQTWRPFPTRDINTTMVEVANVYGDTNKGYISDFWWGYECNNAEGVIVATRLMVNNQQQLWFWIE